MPRGVYNRKKKKLSPLKNYIAQGAVIDTECNEVEGLATSYERRIKEMTSELATTNQINNTLISIIVQIATRR